MSRSRRTWPAVVVLSAVAAAALAVAGASPGLRAPAALWFAFTGPGMALVGLLGIDDVLAELTLAVGLSLALDVAVAGALLYAGAWSPQAALLILAALALAGAAAQLRLSWRDAA